ncbi:hypothetical protein M0813_22276 [Anaeramoeba flamelloides]|uniref:F-box domain-containing protein n=1 Tax=Anaeramoeba flamelloides TaxID=1746091 RepID=A0ABQ8YFC6_9EUKA|nr:hypothetical protein M0813_22276 [Anaeramoeba flamelloides]
MRHIFVYGSNKNRQLLFLDRTEIFSTNKLIDVTKHSKKYFNSEQPFLISCGSTQTFLATKEGTIYGYGLRSYSNINKKNTKKKVGFNNLLFRLKKFKKKKIQQIICNPIQAIILVGGFLYSIDNLNTIQNKQQLGVSKIELPKEITILQVSCGENYFVAKDSNLQLRSWGICSNGELGHGTFSDEKEFPTVLESFKSINACLFECGSYHFLVLSIEGDLFGCGKGENGQLGNNNSQNLSLPKLIINKEVISKDFGLIIQIACGDEHSLLLNSKGTVFVCGKGSSIGRANFKKNTTFCCLDFSLTKPIKTIIVKSGYQQSYSLFISKKNKLYSVGFEFQTKMKNKPQNNSIEIGEFKSTSNPNKNTGEKKMGIEVEKERKNKKDIINEKEKEKERDNFIENENNNEIEIEIEIEIEKEFENDQNNKKTKIVKNQKQDLPLKMKNNINIQKIEIPEGLVPKRIGCGWFHLIIICSKKKTQNQTKPLKKQQSIENKIKELGNFYTLSDELIFKIFDYLDERHLCKLCITSSEIRYFATNDWLWKRLFLKDFKYINQENSQDIYAMIKTASIPNTGYWQAYTSLAKKCKNVIMMSEKSKVKGKEPSQINRFFKSNLIQKKKFTALMVGLSCGGKSSMFSYWVTGSKTAHRLYIGFNQNEIKVHKRSLMITQVSGAPRIIPLWKHYFQAAQGFIYVIDSTDKERIEESQIEFYKCITHIDMLEKPILILASKQDLSNVMTILEISKIFNLDELDRDWLLLAISRFSDIYLDGLKWLISKMSKNK